jgi:hypothetical protein
MIILLVIMLASCLSSVLSGGGVYYFREELNKKGGISDSPLKEPTLESTKALTDSIGTPSPATSTYTAKEASPIQSTKQEEFNKLKEDGEIKGNVLVKNKICIQDWCIFKNDDKLSIRQKNSTGGDNSGSFTLSSDGNLFIVHGSKKGWAAESIRNANNGVNEFKDRTVKFGNTHWIKSKGKDQYIMRWKDGTIGFGGKGDWEKFSFERSNTGDAWGW